MTRFVAWAGAVRARLATPRGRADALATWLAWAAVVLPPFVVLYPWLLVRDTYGFHDWDVMTSHRYLAVTALRDFHELPAWNPYACGGFPAWGYVEGATIVVSPLLPVYWLADIRTAIRVEVLFMALLGSVGAYRLAGRFTEHPAARALVPAVWAYDGRFGLQAASGHAWHLAYALLPWAWLYFERASEKGPLSSDTAKLGAALAALVYAGGIYPLPHAVMMLVFWAAATSILARSWRPVGVLGAGGALGVLLAAPKLVPMMATFARAPRLVDSTETLSPEAFIVLLTSRAQGFFDRPATVRPYGWHEWGMYIGAPLALVLAAAFVAAPGKREGALKVLGASLVLLGFGAFHAWAPWTLLHAHAPFFRSQHVPSRFLYPAVLCLGLVAASGVGRLLSRLREGRPWASAAASAVVLVLGLDVAAVASRPMGQAMTLVAPAAIERASEFHFAERAPQAYVVRDWAAPMYLSMLANTGVLQCYGTPPFEGRGAVARRAPGYRGEAFVDGGRASVSRWTPSSATIAVEGARGGARLVYNMNHDPGWTARVVSGGRASDARVEADHGRVALGVPEGDSTVELRYVPPGLGLGLALGALGLAAASALVLGARARARSSEPTAIEARA